VAGRSAPIDVTTPAGAFAAALRALRDGSGLSLRGLADRAGYAPSTLWAAEQGRKVPGWFVLEAYVQACGADPAEWREAWSRARAAEARAPEAPAATRPTADGPRRRRWRRIAATAAVAVGAAAATAITALAILSRAAAPQVVDGADPDAYAACAGATRLDSKPLYGPGGDLLGYVNVYFSPSCGVAWGHVDWTGTGPDPNAPADFTVQVVTHRDSDRVRAAAPTMVPVGGSPGHGGLALTVADGCVWVEAVVRRGDRTGDRAATSCVFAGGQVVAGAP
jgi:transcriptional regulator with XRE-family HTH domain